MATYTPLKLNQTPTLGTSGASIKSYQTSLNTQNAGQSGYVPLKVDGMFGPLTQAASQFKAPVTNPMVNPTTPTFKPATVPTGTFESQDTANARTAQASYLNSLVQPDENKIYQDTLSKFQAQIDSTNAMYADELSRAKVTGAGRLGTQTAMSARRGLLGSDFGEASAVGQERGNEEVYKSIENERATRVNAILSQAKSDSSSEIRAKREEFTKGLDARLSFYSEADNRKTANSDKAIKALIAQGLGPKDVDPSQLSQIAKYYGISTDDIIAGYDGAKETYDNQKTKMGLENSKTTAEINKINADIAKGKVIELSEGGMLFNTETGETFKNPKTFAPSSGSGSSGLLSGLDTSTKSLVTREATNFGNSPVVKKYNDIITAANFINSTDATSTNPATHQAVIYNFAKMLDPDSVVREGEYATVKKYSQSLLNKYKGEIKQAVNGTGFLSQGAISAIQAETKNRVSAYQPQYQNLKSEYTNRINTYSGRVIGDQMLLNYEAGYTDDGTSGMTDEQLEAAIQAAQ